MNKEFSIAVPADLFEVSQLGHFEGKGAVETLQSGPDVYAFTSPISWSVDVTNTGDALLVTGTAQAEATTQCVRCLEDVHKTLNGDITGYFIINGEEEDVPEDMEGDEFDYLPDNHHIDLLPLIEQAFLLELPVVPLCSEDCLGLCPHCGANLNEGPCNCAAQQEEEIDSSNPFAMLKNLHLDNSPDEE